MVSLENLVYYSENFKSSSLGDKIVLFDRTLEVYGLKFLVGGQVGAQSAVPDEWAYKSAQTVKLMLSPEADGINKTAQENLIKTLKGDTGTWHEGAPTVQRVLKGGSADYSPNPLEDGGYALYGRDVEILFDTHMSNDMIWYQNSSHGALTTAGDTDIQELLEHLMHTIHVYGVRGGVNGSVLALNADVDTAGWNNTELYFSLKEAVDNGAFDISGYNDADYTNPETYAVASKEYTYFLNFGMWEYGSEFWPDKDANGLGMLEGEWADNVRTPEGVEENNPLGFALFNKYFAPVLSKPDIVTLRSMFQDNDQGLSGYIWDSETTHTVTALVETRDGSKISDANIIMSDGTNSSSYKSTADGTASGTLAIGSNATIIANLAYSSSTKAISSQDALDALKLSVGLSTSAGTKTAFDFMSADFNQDGKVSSQDALAILKYSVGLTTPEQAQWVFVDTNGDYSGVSKSNTSYTNGAAISDLSENTSVSLTGILIGDVNDSYSGLIQNAPSLTAGNLSHTLLEDVASGTAIDVGLVTGEDDDIADGNSTLTYSLIGTGNTDFAIDAATGALSVGADGLDFETTPSYTLQVKVEDEAGNSSVTENITLAVGNVNELSDVADLEDITSDQTVLDVGNLEIKGAAENTKVTATFSNLTPVANIVLSENKSVALETSNLQKLNITTADGASILKSLSGDSLETVTIAGDQNVTIENFADATNSNIDIDASALKGDLQVVLSSRGNSNVVGGTGEDIVTILGNFNSGVYSDNEQINALANNASLGILDEFGGAGIDFVRSTGGVFSLGDGNDKVISYGALSSNGLTLEGVETLEIHSLFSTNSLFLQHWGGNEIIFAGSQDHILRIQIVEDIVTGEYITEIDLSMITVAQGNLNIEIYGPPGITLDAVYDVSQVNGVNDVSSQVEVLIFADNRELVMESSDVILADQTSQTIPIAENADIGTSVSTHRIQVGSDNRTGSDFSLSPYSSEPVISTSISFDFTPLFVAAIAQHWGNQNPNLLSTDYEDLFNIIYGSNIRDHYQFTATVPDLSEDYVGASSFEINSFDSATLVGYTATHDVNLDVKLASHLDYETQQEYTLPIFIVDVPYTIARVIEMSIGVDVARMTTRDFLDEGNIEGFLSDYNRITFAPSFLAPLIEVRVIEVPIVVLNVDEVAPIITSADEVSIADNSAAGATIYTVTSTDNEDISEGVVYSITAGVENFSINADTGAVTVNSELEVGEYAFTVKATDGEDNSTDRDGVETTQHIKIITVTVTETDTTPPTILDISPITLAENVPLQTTVATVTASDDGGAVTYSLDESSPTIFAIDNLSGVITLTAGLDYEIDQQYSITVVATDPADNESLSVLSINVGNVDEAAPTIAVGNTTIDISEDTVAGSSLNIALTTNDDDDVVEGETASLTYSLVGENRSDFVINEDTGDVTIGEAGLDFETTPEYSLQVRVTDQAENINVTDIVDINVGNVDEAAPTITVGNTTIDISEDTVAGSSLNIALTTNDDDDVVEGETASFTYSLVGGNSSDFVINEDTGDVAIGEVGLDFETTSEYSLNIRLTDQAGNISETDAIEINVIDVEEGNPVITSLLTGTLTSPVPAANVGNAFYRITADYPNLDGLGELTYSISNNPGSIRVNEDTGEIFLNASPGYSVTFNIDEITFDATVTDLTGLFDTEAITILII